MKQALCLFFILILSSLVCAGLELEVFSPIEPQTYTSEKVLINFSASRDASCSYRLNYGNKVTIFGSLALIRVMEGDNNLQIECDDSSETVSAEIVFTASIKKKPFMKRFWSEMNSFVRKIKIKSPSTEKKILLLEHTFGNSNKLDKNIETEHNIDIDKNIVNQGDGSVVSIKLRPKRVMRNVTIIEEIPKSMAESAKDIEFENDNYIIIDDDPLIMWHFSELSEEAEISYKIRGYVNESELPATVPVAEEITNESINRISGSAIGGQRGAIELAVPLIALPFICFVIILFRRFLRKIERSK